MKYSLPLLLLLGTSSAIHLPSKTEDSYQSDSIIGFGSDFAKNFKAYYEENHKDMSQSKDSPSGKYSYPEDDGNDIGFDLDITSALETNPKGTQRSQSKDTDENQDEDNKDEIFNEDTETENPKGNDVNQGYWLSPVKAINPETMDKNDPMNALWDIKRLINNPLWATSPDESKHNDQQELEDPLWATKQGKSADAKPIYNDPMWAVKDSNNGQGAFDKINDPLWAVKDLKTNSDTGDKE